MLSPLQHYFAAFARAMFGGALWWLSLSISWLLGIGFFNEYPAVKKRLTDLLQVSLMPDAFPLWLLAALFLLWVVARLAHREAMRHLRAARVLFHEVATHRSVDLNGWVPAKDGSLARVNLGLIDIASIKVSNSPYDGAEGKAVLDAFARIDIYDRGTRKTVLSFDYPRWEGNPKPGYHDHPRDHYPDDWNRRMLPPSGERHRLDFLVRNWNDGKTYGFRGRSQIKHLWSDTELQLACGEYIAKLTVSGAGLRQPAEEWLAISIGADGTLEVAKTKPLNMERW